MKTDAVILAAGYSSRAGAFKMEFPLGGKTVLQCVIEAFLPICNKVIVVGGYQIERLFPLVREYGDKVEVIYNEDFDKGMFSSVRKGITKVRGDNFFITPGDCALITTTVCTMLQHQKGSIIMPVYKNLGGHPILLRKECISEIMQEPEDSNLKSFLKKKKVVRMECEDIGILFDIDTKEDRARAEEIMLEKRLRK